MLLSPDRKLELLLQERACCTNLQTEMTDVLTFISEVMLFTKGRREINWLKFI